MISPNGNEIATVERDRSAINIYSLQGTLRRSLSLSGWTPLLVDWAADGKSLLLSASKQSGFALLRAYFNGSTQVLWNFQNFETWALAKPIPSPDGQSLAIQNTTGDRNAWIVDLP
jgi:Tol biopolymer transport system component